MRKTFFCIVFLLKFSFLIANIIRIPLKRTQKSSQIEQTESNGFFGTLQATVSSFKNMRLKNFRDLQYAGTLMIGSKKQTFQVIFDTGSDWIFIPSLGCKTCITSQYFSCTDSETCYTANSNGFLNVTYGKGFVSGTIISDKVYLSDELFVEKQNFIYAQEEQDFEGFAVDGLCGMGVSSFWDYSYKNKNNIIQNLYNDGKIKNLMFSFKINREALNSDENYSEMIIGGYDNSSFYDELAFFNVVNYHYWAIEMDEVKFNKNFTITRNSEALLDTGTSYIVAPKNDFNNILNELRFQGKTCVITNGILRCACPTGNLDEFPTLFFRFSGKDFSLEPEYYVSQTSHICTIYLSTLDGITDMWILGDRFLNKYYTVFDGGSKKIGLAKMKVYDVEIFKPTSIILIVSMIIIGIVLASLAIYFLKKYFKIRKNNERNLLPNSS